MDIGRSRVNQSNNVADETMSDVQIGINENSGVNINNDIHGNTPNETTADDSDITIDTVCELDTMQDVTCNTELSRESASISQQGCADYGMPSSAPRGGFSNTDTVDLHQHQPDHYVEEMEHIPLNTDITAPPPDYNEYVINEYYITKGLACSESQTDPMNCQCMCHGNYNGHIYNGGEMARSDATIFSPFICEPQGFPTTHLHETVGNTPMPSAPYYWVQPQCTNNTSSNVGNNIDPQDKVPRTVVIGLFVLIVIGAIIAGIVIATTD